MKLMTLMAVVALAAAGHSIANRIAQPPEVLSTMTAIEAMPIRTHDLPAVKVYAEPEPEPAMPAADTSTAAVAMAPRIVDLEPVRVHPTREQVFAYRQQRSRLALGIPRGSMRRGLSPEQDADDTTQPMMEVCIDRAMSDDRAQAQSDCGSSATASALYGRIHADSALTRRD